MLSLAVIGECKVQCAVPLMDSSYFLGVTGEELVLDLKKAPECKRWARAHP